MLHVCMMRLKFCYGRTNERTNKAILGVGYTVVNWYRMVEWAEHLQLLEVNLAPAQHCAALL